MQSVLRMAIVLAVTYSGQTRVANEAPTPEEIKWQPPTIHSPLSLPQPTVPREIVSRIRVSKLLVVLEETKMTDVQKRLGGSFGHSGDASEALEWLCYYGADAEGRWALWLESSETAGGAVDGFLLQRLERDTRMDRRCGDLQDGRIDLPIPLNLGITEKQVQRLLGKPTLKFRNTLVFGHEHAETLHQKPYTASNTVYIALRRGVVWAIEAWKSTLS